MNPEGHIGLSILLSSIVMLPFGFNEYALIVIFFSAVLSVIPDYDMKWRKYGVKHRGKHTHSVLFAIVSGLILGCLCFWAFGTILWSLMGFSGAVLGVVSHLIGDTFTYHAFQPLWPISDREISFGFFAASDKKANDALLIIGGIVFIFYFLITSSSL